MTYTIDFEPVGIRLVCQEAQTISEAARQAGACIRSECGGKAVCGKCLVRVEPPASAVSEVEQSHLNPAQIQEGWRLACRAVISADTRVYIPAISQTQGQVIQTEGLAAHFTPAPAVRVLAVKLEPPSLENPISDLQRVAFALRLYGIEDAWAGLPTLNALRQALREGGWQAVLALRGNEIIAAFAGEATFGGTELRPVGLAVDIGTTKLACYLVNLESGQVLAAMGVMNPQIAYGEDVMSRLEAVMLDPANAGRLQKDVIETVSQAAAALCASQQLRPEHLLDVCVVGNTAMHHLFANIPTRPLALAPFIPALCSALDVDTDRLGLRAAPGARVHLPAPIAGFVGSDHLAFLLAAGFGEDSRVRLGLDIGTNTEIALQASGRIVTCSTASGPAFEGAHIRHGMRAAPGAIEHVAIGLDGLPRCCVIGGGAAVGICGSGILDAVAELRRANLINERGRMSPATPSILLGEDGSPYYVLAPARDGRRAVTITQHDIDQILLAKGAMRAGIDILLDHLGLQASDLDEIVIAGAFGSYLDPASAVRIGLLPNLPLEKVHAVGNAAGSGACMLLASTEYRAAAQALARRIEYLELTVVPGFNRYFAHGVRLPLG